MHGEYAEYFNEKYEVTGHLWEGRFFSCVLDEWHFWQAIRYVERNPVRAGLVDRAENYEWSSAATHCGLRDDPLLKAIPPLPGSFGDWSAWLAIEELDADLAEIRKGTRTGRPCGSELFLKDLERKLGRVLVPNKRGGSRYRRQRLFNSKGDCPQLKVNGW